MRAFIQFSTALIFAFTIIQPSIAQPPGTQTKKVVQRAVSRADDLSKLNRLSNSFNTSAPVSANRSVGSAQTSSASFSRDQISGYTNHGLNQKMNRQVRTTDINDAMKKPLKINEPKVDQYGRSSQRYIGEKSEVVINPSSGKIVSVNPTSTRKAKALGQNGD